MMMIFIALLLVRSSTSFLITYSEPGRVVVAPGDKVSLLCAVDDDYEWCKFYHPNGKFCDFEWKRRKKNITMQECQMSNKSICYTANIYNVICFLYLNVL